MRESNERICEGNSAYCVKLNGDACYGRMDALSAVDEYLEARVIRFSANPDQPLLVGRQARLALLDSINANGVALRRLRANSVT
jgi:hypothetical protein